MLSSLLISRRWAGLLLLSGLLATRPASAQWTTQNSGLATRSGIQSLSIVDANTVWAAGYGGANPTAAYNAYTRTTNGGTTWTTGTLAAASGQLFMNISAASATTAWAATVGTSSGGYLYYTTDGGSTWARQLSTGFPSASEGYINGVLAFDASTAIAAGDPLSTTNLFEIYTTTNAGSTWTAATTVPTRLTGEYGAGGTLVTVPGSTATARACWLGTSSGRVLRSTNSGVTWTAATTGLSAVTELAFCSATNGLAFNANNPTLLARTTDGGATWTTFTPTGPYYTSGLAGVPGQANAFVSTGNDNNGTGSSYSTDGGATWTAIDAGVAHTSVAFLNSATGWSGGFSTSATVGGIYRGVLAALPTATTTRLNPSSVSLYPNPAVDRFTVQVPAVLGTTQVQATLLNALGQTIQQQTAALPAAGTALSFDAAELARGLYLVRVQAGSEFLVKRLIMN